nr:hypothetical protein B0A51_17730 [Rachicladosporium sp. CCFEE 5018]
MSTELTATSINDNVDNETIKVTNSDESGDDEESDFFLDDDTSVESSLTTVDDENEVKCKEGAAKSSIDGSDSDEGSVYSDTDSFDGNPPAAGTKPAAPSSLRHQLLSDSRLEVHHGLGALRACRFKRPLKASHQALRLKKVRRENEETEFLFAPERKVKVDFDMRW